jgi:PHD/YefM family antitoxin component YafN of YafNO toxin-antitoxin module
MGRVTRRLLIRGTELRTVSVSNTVLMLRADYDALEVIAHLLRAPANAQRLIENLQQAMSGQRETHDLTS